MNELMEKLGLHPVDPVERFWANPGAVTLKALGKTAQTEEMVKAAVERDPGFEY